MKPHHLLHFYVAALFTIMLAVSINALQPYLLHTFLRLPPREHGSASGKIGTLAEVVLLGCLGLWGALSDRIGRRVVYVCGFAVMGAGYLATAFSRTFTDLLLARGLYTVGVAAATAMLATITADYVINEDRGKASAIMGVANGLGAVAGALGLAKLPGAFADLGGIEAGRRAYFVCAGLCFAVSVWLFAGLQGGKPAQAAAERLPVGRQLSEGIRAARDDVGVTLSYAAAFVSRADLAAAGVFIPLWFTKHFAAQVDPASVADLHGALDRATADGVKAGGALIAISGSAALLFAPVIGVLCDRIHRVHALVVGLGMNVLGYGLTAFVSNPVGPLLYGAAALIGFGQVGGVIASQVLIQQQAPAAYRGSVVGVFGTCGAAGVMLTLLLGGFLFDRVRETAPFALVAVMNMAVVALALAVRARVRAPGERGRTSELVAE